MNFTFPKSFQFRNDTGKVFLMKNIEKNDFGIILPWELPGQNVSPGNLPIIGSTVVTVALIG